MTAPTDTAVEVVHDEPDTGEMRVRFPVVVIEGIETSDGRYLNAGSLTHRALPLSLLACPESAHGGDDPSAAVVIGRIDTLVRTPGPDVLSPRTGEPFPEGSFVWSGEGAIDANHPVADLVRRRFLRGVSVDLAGMDVELVGDDEALADAEHPRRRMIAHAAEIAAVTLVPIPAFSDAYVELADETAPPEVVPLDEIPEGLVASASPAWRSVEVGDRVAVVASADPWPAGVPADAVEQIAAVIADDNGEQRDASELAAAIVAHISAQWAAGDTDSEMPDQEEAPAMAADPAPADAEAEPVDEVGMPDAPQSCEAVGTDTYESEVSDHPAVRSLLYDDRRQFAAICDEHDEWARGQIADLGFEVDEVVDIVQPADDGAAGDVASTPTASRA